MRLYKNSQILEKIKEMYENRRSLYIQYPSLEKRALFAAPSIAVSAERLQRFYKTKSTGVKLEEILPNIARNYKQ